MICRYACCEAGLSWMFQLIKRSRVRMTGVDMKKVNIPQYMHVLPVGYNVVTHVARKYEKDTYYLHTITTLFHNLPSDN